MPRLPMPLDPSALRCAGVRSAAGPVRSRCGPGAGLVLSLGLVLSACVSPPNPPPPAPRPPATESPPAPAAPVAQPPADPPAPPPSPSPSPTRERDATQRLLSLHERARELPPVELSREIGRLETRLLVAPLASTAASGAAPVRDEAAAAAAAQLNLELALLLALQRQNGDLLRALALLEPLQRPGAPAATLALARLLYTRLAEQRRLEEQLERQTQALRELQRRADQLAAQLEALRAIERSLNTRPAPPAPPPANPR